LRPPASLVGAFIARGFRATAPRRHSGRRVPRIFVCLRLPALLVCAWVPRPVRLGRGLHRLQLAPRALLPYARGHSHLRQPHRGRLARLALRRGSHHVKRPPLHGSGYRRCHARRSRHGAISAGSLEFRSYVKRCKIKKGALRNRRTRLFSLLEIAGRHIFVMSTDARVVSHSMIRGQPFGALPNAIVKFSTAEGIAETFMSTRARSESAPG